LLEHDLYHNSVIFYGTSRNKNYVLKAKERFFKKHFEQEIISEIDIKRYKSGIIKCEFTKRTKSGNVINEHLSYLLLKKENNNYFITSESDYLTDKNKNINLELGELLADDKTLSRNILVFLSIIVAALWFYIKRGKNQKSVVSINESKPNLEHTTTFGDNITAYDVGLEFEKFISQRFDRNSFELVEWRGDKYHEGVYAKSNQYPDMEWVLNHQFAKKSKFAIECKYRKTTDINSSVELCKDYQLNNYKEFEKNKNMPVFIVLGIGGTPTNPEELYIIPLRILNNAIINLKSFKKFKKRNPLGTFFYNWKQQELL
jgi:hypothetical protein